VKDKVYSRKAIIYVIREYLIIAVVKFCLLNLYDSLILKPNQQLISWFPNKQFGLKDTYSFHF